MFWHFCAYCWHAWPSWWWHDISAIIMSLSVSLSHSQDMPCLTSLKCYFMSLSLLFSGTLSFLSAYPSPVTAHARARLIATHVSYNMHALFKLQPCHFMCVVCHLSLLHESHRCSKYTFRVPLFCLCACVFRQEEMKEGGKGQRKVEGGRKGKGGGREGGEGQEDIGKKN